MKPKKPERITSKQETAIENLEEYLEEEYDSLPMPKTKFQAMKRIDQLLKQAEEKQERLGESGFPYPWHY